MIREHWTIGPVDLVKLKPSKGELQPTRYFMNNVEIDFFNVEVDYGEYPRHYKLDFIVNHDRLSQKQFPTGYSHVPQR